jgi:hypothetical protein
MLKFNWKYFTITVIIFLVEVYIALYEDGWIRSYLGDILVVILIYAAIRSILKLPVMTTAIGVLLFSFVVEFSQYYDLVHTLGLQHNKIALIVLGNTYHWLDLLSYTIGIVIVIIIEIFTGNLSGNN